MTELNSLLILVSKCVGNLSKNVVITREFRIHQNGEYLETIDGVYRKIDKVNSAVPLVCNIQIQMR